METKKMWIIECLDVPTHFDHVEINLGVNTTTGESDIRKLELIDPERLRYGIPSHDNPVRAVGTGVNAGIRVYNGGSNHVLIIDPPKPKETVKEVMSRMPDLFDDCWADTMDYEMINILKDWQADLKKAQEGR